MGLARHFAKHPGDPGRRGLDRPHGKSRYHLRISQTGSAVLHRTVGWMAGDAAVRGVNIVDSAGFRHIRVPGLAQRQVRRDRREAVRKTARRARPRGHGMRRGGHAWQGKRLAVFEGDAGGDAARIRPYAGRRPILRSRKLPGGTGQRTPRRNRAQNRLQNRGRRRQGGDAEVSRGTPRHLPQVVAETEQRRERLLVHEGKVRGRGAGRQDENPDRRVAVRLHLLQHGFRARAATRGRRRPRMRGSLRSHVSKLPETGPARPSGARGGPIVADQRRRFRLEGPRTAWPAS